MYKIILIAVTALCIGLPAMSHAVIKKGAQLPVFSATTAKGEKVSSTLYNGKVLLIMISSEYCTYCKMAIPHLNRLESHYGTAGMSVVGLITGPGFGIKSLKNYIANNDVSFTMNVTDNKTLYETIGAYSVPTFLLINKKGTVTGYFRGYSEVHMEIIEKQIQTLLAEK
ncbi:MAG: TlpA family protein disulfide reductase [Desulfuromonadaceae bacterium]